MPPNQTLIERSLSDMRADMGEMRIGLQQIAEAVTRLAVVEERHKSLEGSLGRIEDRVEKMDDRQRAAEITRDVVITMSTRLSHVERKVENNQLDQAKFEATIRGVTGTMKYMWVAFGGGVGFVALQLFNVIKAGI